MPLRVLHLAGSAVDDFFCELSRVYAADCLRSTADPSRYEFHVAYVTPDGNWRFPSDLGRPAIDAAAPMPAAEAVAHVVDLGIEVMVPQMFCLPGMTYYRGLFDLLGIPYVGNTPDVMALTANKAKARAVVAAAGVDVPAGEVVRRGERPTLAPPVVVKPVDADNSSGMTLVRDAADLDAALAAALEHGPAALVESFVPLGREVRCGVVERDGELVALPLEEYALSEQQPVRVRTDKVAPTDDGGVRLVAKNAPTAWIVDVTDPLTAVVHDVATRCHVALGCRDYSLFDFRIDASGRPWFLEAGLYSSFAQSSVISTMALAAGTALDDLFASMLARAPVTRVVVATARRGPTPSRATRRRPVRTAPTRRTA